LLVAWAQLGALAFTACGTTASPSAGSQSAGGANANEGGALGGALAGQSSNAGSPTAAGTGANEAGSSDVGGQPPLSSADDAPSEDVRFAASEEVLLNPERGFYASTSLVDAPDLSGLRAAGVTLVHSYVRLDAYRTLDLPPTLLTQVAAGFAKAREAGVKVLLRFAYNFGPYPDSEPDAPKSWVLTHIQELKPLLQDNADVIAVVQAGFIGAWGEWHSSTNDLTEPTTRQEILEALLGAVPPSRSVQLRYPPYKRLLYGEALTAAEAFGPTPAARVGHHNDCFVSSDDDVGTYPTDQIDFFRDYVAADSAFVPVGGETCAPSPPRSECPSALAEMQKLHFSYINGEFQSDVLSSWSSCMTEMQKRLGYRLLLQDAALPSRLRPGGSFTLRATLENRGFAAPFNARPVFVVLRGPGGVRLRAQLQKADPRRWLGEGHIEARLRVPATLAPGRYRLGLWLPDAAASLQPNSDYALRFANLNVWDEASGENTLGELDIDDSAPGSALDDATTFEVLAE
jgi:hypothetical protein